MHTILLHLEEHLNKGALTSCLDSCCYACLYYTNIQRTFLIKDQREKTDFRLFWRYSEGLCFSLPAVCLIPSNSSSRIRQPCCHARLEPELPLLIAAMRLRKGGRAESAHKETGWSEANRQEGRKEARPMCRDSPISLDHNSGWQEPLMSGQVRIIKL